ncbi:MAG: cytochrome C oxidase subunit IV family protein [Thermoanaerobaculia bacterium]|nr:cytochrome C oxidase subunit IV family protein [Thermoanaerobaculia bacterium]
MGGHTADEIKKSVRTYMVVFAALAALTVLTVAASYLHLPTSMTILVALVIASAKGSLVALFFMHLIDERKAIYWILGLTVVFFIALMFLPVGTVADTTGI